MLVMNEKQRLYLSNWEYNASLILTELAKIVLDNGGRVKPLNTAIISNRTIEEAIITTRARLERIEKNKAENNTINFDFYINNLKSDIEKYENIDNEPVEVTHTSYISFVLDGMYYYYQVDDNPFFPFYYIKTEIREDGVYSKDACLEEDTKTWRHDCFFKFDCSMDDIKEAANMIFDMLVQAKKSFIRIEYTKKRVPNYYNNGYHYEKIYNRERFGKVDF